MPLEDNANSTRRRIFSPEWKCRVVKQATRSESSVSSVAREHDLNTNQVFRWMREFEQGKARWVRLVRGELPVTESNEPTRFLPLALAEPSPESQAPEPASPCIVVELASGHRMTLDTCDPKMLKVLLSALA